MARIKVVMALAVALVVVATKLVKVALLEKIHLLAVVAVTLVTQYFLQVYLQRLATLEAVE
jgi:hypothetical protein